MNRHQKPRPLIARNRAYRRALHRLDESLERETKVSNAENTRLRREALFPDVEELRKSGEVIIPK